MKLKLFKQAVLLFVFVTFIQCENHEQDWEVDKSISLKLGHNVLENGRIISKAVLSPMPVDQVQPAEVQQDDTIRKKPNYIAHGDILIPLEDIEYSSSKRSKRKIIVEANRFGESNRWPRGVVPYEFIANIDSGVQQKVLAAMNHWHQRTCIRFEPYNSQRHWDIGARIIIDDDVAYGCGTYVGYRPYPNDVLSPFPVHLPSQCPLGSAIHELGHVTGFYHEMARTDRDLEINLYFNRMSITDTAQYDIMPNPMPGYYGQPYDLGSIMHYYPTDVMSARDDRRSFLMGQRIGLSYLDTKLSNLAYHCADKCNPKPTCLNEGYVDQYCKCICPDGFYGDQCNSLQGYLDTTSRILPPTDGSSTKLPTEKTSTNATVHWLEWSDWSNCSESCSSGIRVRTRLCSDTTIKDSTNPCSSLGGDSFEIESCQNPECKQADIIMSCTFDITDEKCPIKTNNDWQIQNSTLKDRNRPISDHTCGDGKYLLLIKSTNESYNLPKFQLGPFTHANSSNEQNQCLQFWYSLHGEGIGKLTVVNNKIKADPITFNWKDQGTNWKQVQQTISVNNNYELNFEYQSTTSEHRYLAIDDISITNGACLSKKINNQRRRKRRQTNSGCSRIIDLTAQNVAASITSPNYPNLYPSNTECYYYIRAPVSNRIVLQFTDFNVLTSNTNNCDDAVEIRYYHIGQSGPRYCGTGANSNNLQFISTKNNLMIVFRSNSNYAGRGFRAQVLLAL